MTFLIVIDTKHTKHMEKLKRLLNFLWSLISAKKEEEKK